MFGLIFRVLRRVLIAVCALGALVAAPALAQTCPTEDPAIEAAKSHTVYLYFPTTADSSFPAYDTNVSPAQPFSAPSLNAALTSTSALIGTIGNVVADDYCEFDVKVVTTTTNPASLASPSARRVTVAVGADSNNGTWGEAQEVDIGDQVDIDFARVWAGTYVACEGGAGPSGSGCSSAGSLTGTNATVTHWAQAIGGTSAHEAGHTYGLSHSDDDPQSDACDPGEDGFAPIPGEDAFNKHLMPSGCNLTGPDRADYRRHFSDRDYGILATNVGLSIETMHNWDLVNPNAQSGASLAIDFLSQKSSITIAWFYNGSQSPWLNPTVSGPTGTATFKGQTYNKYRITWSAPNPAWHTPTPGVVGGGEVFHIGATFIGVDFNTPEPIIIQNVTLYNSSNAALALHPRLPIYDAGSVDAAAGSDDVTFTAPPGAPNLRLVSAQVAQLPRVASIDSMVGAGAPFTWDKQPIRPWSVSRCAPSRVLEKGVKCKVAALTQPPHVSLTRRLGQPGVVDCAKGRVPVRGPVTNGDSIHSPDYEGPVLRPAPRGSGDSTHAPDFEGPYCAGTERDPFPSATVYIIATFVDPAARHWVPARKAYVTGPVTSKVYYQYAGRRHGETKRAVDVNRGA
jgi:hypothetical protein